MSLNLNILLWSLLVTLGLVDHKTKSILLVEGGICIIFSISYDYYQPYQEMVLNLNILLLVTFGYFWSCGPQDQKYTFGGGICRIFLTLNDYYQPYQ